MRGAHCGSLNVGLAIGKIDICFMSCLGYASKVPSAPTKPVVCGGMYGSDELRLSSLSFIKGGRPIEERGEALKEESETKDGVSVDRFDCTEGEGNGVG